MPEVLANVASPSKVNYQIPGDVSLSFRKRGSTKFEDWVGLGDIHGHAIAAEIERLEHFTMRRGSRSLDRTAITERTATLNFSIHEFNFPNFKFIVSSTAAAVQDTIDLIDMKTIINPGAGSVIKLGQTDIVPGSVILRSALQEEVDLVTFVEGFGNDYTEDSITGEITILAGGLLADPDDLAGHKQIHWFYRKNVETQRVTIWKGTEVEGEAQFQVLTVEGAKYVFHFPSVVIQNNGDLGLGDGTDWQSVDMSMRVLIDENGDLGFFHYINDDEVDE